MDHILIVGINKVSIKYVCEDPRCGLDGTVR
jgi:hypothetical protein